MQRPNQLFFLPLVGLFLMFQSCSIQKRHYLKGFYIARTASSEYPVKNKKHPPTIQSFYTHKVVSAGTEQSAGLKPIEKEKRKIPGEKSAPLILSGKKVVEDCDTLFLVNGKKVVGKITEAGVFVIKIKNCAGISESITEIPRSYVKEIHFQNGVVEKIEQAELKKEQRQIKKNEPSKGGRYIALALVCLLLACLFALGVVWFGFYYLLIPIAFLVLTIIFSTLAFKAFKQNGVN